MIQKFAFVISFLLTICSCFGQQNLLFGKVDHYKTTKFDSAIFPADYIDLIPGVRFTPTREEVDKAEIALELTIKNLNKNLINQTDTPIIHKSLINTSDSILVTLTTTAIEYYLLIFFGQKTVIAISAIHYG